MYRRTYTDAFFFQCDTGQADHLSTIRLHGPVEEGVLFNTPSFACTDLSPKDSMNLYPREAGIAVLLCPLPGGGVDILVALHEVLGFKKMQTGFLPHAVGRHPILDAQDDYIAGITLRLVAVLCGTDRCQTRIDRKLGIGITRGVGLPEGIVTRQTCSNSNLMGTKIKIGKPRQLKPPPVDPNQ